MLHAIQELTVLTGFYRDPSSQSTQSRTFRDVRYMLKVGAVPLDRALIRQTNVIYIEQFPDKFELLRDDLEAFHKMMDDGGVLILIAGPDSTPSTIKNFDYLGKTRFGFEFAESMQGHILPVIPGEGLMNGNVYYCERGMKTMKLSGEGWRVHYRASDAQSVAAASARVGKGMLVLVGTREIDRPNESNPQSALTLIDWAFSQRDKPQPMTTTVSSSDPRNLLDRVTLGQPQIEEIMKQPDSDLLAERLTTLRRALGPSDEPVKLTGSPLLIPKEKRTYFPRLSNAFDLDGKVVDIDDMRDSLVLVIYWASWDHQSRLVLGEIRDVLPRFQGKPIEVVGISLDRSIESVRRFNGELGINWRNVFDGRGYESPVLLRPPVQQIPRVFLIDRDGRLCAQDLPPALLGRAITDALGEAR